MLPLTTRLSRGATIQTRQTSFTLFQQHPHRQLLPSPPQHQQRYTIYNNQTGCRGFSSSHSINNNPQHSQTTLHQNNPPSPHLTTQQPVPAWTAVSPQSLPPPGTQAETTQLFQHIFEFWPRWTTISTRTESTQQFATQLDSTQYKYITDTTNTAATINFADIKPTKLIPDLMSKLKHSVQFSEDEHHMIKLLQLQAQDGKLIQGDRLLVESFFKELTERNIAAEITTPGIKGVIHQPLVEGLPDSVPVNIRKIHIWTSYPPESLPTVGTKAEQTELFNHIFEFWPKWDGISKTKSFIDKTNLTPTSILSQVTTKPHPNPPPARTVAWLQAQSDRYLFQATTPPLQLMDAQSSTKVSNVIRKDLRPPDPSQYVQAASAARVTFNTTPRSITTTLKQTKDGRLQSVRSIHLSKVTRRSIFLFGIQGCIFDVDFAPLRFSWSILTKWALEQFNASPETINMVVWGYQPGGKAFRTDQPRWSKTTQAYEAVPVRDFTRSDLDSDDEEDIILAPPFNTNFTSSTTTARLVAEHQNTHQPKLFNNSQRHPVGNQTPEYLKDYV